MDEPAMTRELNEPKPLLCCSSPPSSSLFKAKPKLFDEAVTNIYRYCQAVAFSRSFRQKGTRLLPNQRQIWAGLQPAAVGPALSFALCNLMTNYDTIQKIIIQPIWRRDTFCPEVWAWIFKFKIGHELPIIDSINLTSEWGVHGVFMFPNLWKSYHIMHLGYRWAPSWMDFH